MGFLFDLASLHSVQSIGNSGLLDFQLRHQLLLRQAVLLPQADKQRDLPNTDSRMHQSTANEPATNAGSYEEEKGPACRKVSLFVTFDCFTRQKVQ